MQKGIQFHQASFNRKVGVYLCLMVRTQSWDVEDVGLYLFMLRRNLKPEDDRISYHVNGRLQAAPY